MSKWNGTAWAPVTGKRWNGSTWVAVTGKRWDGNSWVALDGGEPPVEPSTQYWCSFDAGVVGQTVKTSDTGQGTPWNTVSSNAPIYASPGKSGALCCEVNTSVNPTSYMQWNATASTKGRMGFWFKKGANPASDARIIDFRQTSSSGTVGGLLLIPSGAIRLMVASSGVSPQTSPVLTTGEWYWITLGWDATAKVVRYVIYTSTGVEVYDTGSVSVTSSYTQFGTCRIGAVTAGAYGVSQWDECQFDLESAEPLVPWSP